MSPHQKFFPFYILILMLCFSVQIYAVAIQDKTEKPNDIVSLADVDPSILIEARYYGQNNFIGKTIDGYFANKCLLTQKAALALKAAQADLMTRGYGLKVYDCYRPQRAVDHFVRWAKDIKDTKMKLKFYPDVPKTQLFERGYIAEKSSHTRASTVDITLVPLQLSAAPKAIPSSDLKRCDLSASERVQDGSIDMGTGYDCFSERSHTMNPTTNRLAKAHRMELKKTLESQGFVNYDKEWWHFTLKDEPYPDTFFDFIVR